MALYSVDSQRYVDYIPYREDFDRWRSRLGNDQFDSTCNKLRGMIVGGEVHTAGWMPIRSMTYFRLRNAPPR